MASEKTFTFDDVSKHTTKKDLYIVIHEKVYDCTDFVDEHPGGEEALLEVAGIDASDAFEDVGHSDEAREILQKFLIGSLRRLPGDEPLHGPVPTQTSSTFSGIKLLLLLLVSAAAVHFSGAYKYLEDVDAREYAERVVAVLNGQSLDTK
ncbi:cytochrome b5 [Thelonectria olida]|uniref:Cytochrome b5 n=1 Tax=Thelonectria olida TaxID=1576542 RepID=A0A9P8W3U8_9HYPO|nr:cytochrome b5 [Thelonectria olida]